MTDRSISAEAMIDEILLDGGDSPADAYMATDSSNEDMPSYEDLISGAVSANNNEDMMADTIGTDARVERFCGRGIDTIVNE